MFPELGDDADEEAENEREDQSSPVKAEAQGSSEKERSDEGSPLKNSSLASPPPSAIWAQE